MSLPVFQRFVLPPSSGALLALKTWMTVNFVISFAFTGTFHVTLHNPTAASHSIIIKCSVYC
jgi:hypothetical protein